MSRWNQASCDACWNERNPDRPAFRLLEETGDEETCSWCGETTHSGIYVRADPASVPYPREEDD